MITLALPTSTVGATRSRDQQSMEYLGATLVQAQDTARLLRAPAQPCKPRTSFPYGALHTRYDHGMSPAEYLDNLRSVVGRFAAPIDVGAQPDALLFALLEVATEPDEVGLVLSAAAAPVSGTTVLFVSPRVLEDLDYADHDAYQMALSQVSPSFVHPDDLEVVNDHIRWRSSAAYKARLRRGVGTAVYREMAIQGWTLNVPTVGEIRVTLLRQAPIP